MDPLSLVIGGAAAGGIAGKMAEKFTGYLVDLMRGQDARVQENAQRNAAAFLSELGRQMERHGGRRLPEKHLDEALGDPDIASTMRDALTGAARTASKQKHDALARAVAERLMAESESNRALASVLAVDAIPKLSAMHLRFLGIAAVTYVVRPLPYWYFDLEVDGSVRGQRKGRRFPSYSAWLKGSLEQLHLQVDLSQLQIAHLASVGCLTYERKLRRDLAKVLQPDMLGIDPRSGIDLETRADIAEFLHLDSVGRDLAGLWEFGLQHVTLTPAGTLIGNAVYESVGGDPIETDWSSHFPPRDDVVEDNVWDGRSIREEFLEALDEAVKDRTERRVGPWHRLD